MLFKVLTSHRTRMMLAGSVLIALSASAEAGPYLADQSCFQRRKPRDDNRPGISSTLGAFRTAPPAPFGSRTKGKIWRRLYSVTGPTTVSKVNINAPNGFVSIPTVPSGPPVGPTGQVNNTNANSFHVNNGGNGNRASFIFANLNGTISAWNGGQSAIVQQTVQGASFHRADRQPGADPIVCRQCAREAFRFSTAPLRRSVLARTPL